jgi:hypothetical protein
MSHPVLQKVMPGANESPSPVPDQVHGTALLGAMSLPLGVETEAIPKKHGN